MSILIKNNDIPKEGEKYLLEIRHDGTVYDAIGHRAAVIATQFDENVSPWHRVEELLPDDSRDVIIFTASRIIGVGSFIRPNWYQWYSGGGLPVDVTHWMPLPEPPKEDA